MKRRNAKLITILALTLFAASAFADHRSGYGKRGYYNGYRDHEYRQGTHSRDRRGYNSHDRNDRYAPLYSKRRPIYGPYQPGNYYRPNRGQHFYSYDGHRSDYISYAPILAGSLIGGVIGAGIGGSDPAALGGALLGASIGRDIAYRHAYRN